MPHRQDRGGRSFTTETTEHTEVCRGNAVPSSFRSLSPANGGGGRAPLKMSASTCTVGCRSREEWEARHSHNKNPLPIHGEAAGGRATWRFARLPSCRRCAHHLCRPRSGGEYRARPRLRRHAVPSHGERGGIQRAWPSHALWSASRYLPSRFLSSTVSAGTILCMSPTTPKRARLKIGASGSLLMARMFLEVRMPA